ncbi:disintegrin and metalloproteinase domain-containing protein 10 homolog [Dreissena polymorpha]|uniref:Peptidase M12B domain-containing protein n=1 Tax=Dreissena polymorpha TaxID=45954 RepID=A0A9D4RQL6_DREPO|nr:disintegrin and metalloproteinase domain-containing protein 10 homolog [Dreissena polymorpha]KAH3877876.1 hypothetical protein DPMN_001755 [Dreissena polymorpha]
MGLLNTLRFMHLVAILAETFAGIIQSTSESVYEPMEYNHGVLWQTLQKATATERIMMEFSAFQRVFSLEIYCRNRSHTHAAKRTSVMQPSTNDVIFCSGRETNDDGSVVLLTVHESYIEGTIRIHEFATYHIVRSESITGRSNASPSVIYNGFATKTIESVHHHHSTDMTEEKSLGLRRKSRSPLSYGMAADQNLTTRVCSLELTTDPFVWRYVLQKHDQNKTHAVQETHAMLLDHVNVLNKVFRGVQFTVNTDGTKQTENMNIQFKIHKINIWNDSMCDQTSMNICNPLLEYHQVLQSYGDAVLYRRLTKDEVATINYPDYDTPAAIDDDYLHDDYFSNRHGQYCLSVLFTSRKLHKKSEDGNIPVNGLAMGAEIGTSSEGVCKEHNFAYVNLYRDAENPYKPSTLTHLVLAHEVAHSLGAKHDTDTTSCKPLMDGAIFLMHNVTVDGKDPNHYRLSPCSVDSITKILSDSSRTSCFEEQTRSVCGNGLIEGGEECDCGTVCYLDDGCHSYEKEKGCSLKYNTNNSNSSADGSINKTINGASCRHGLCTNTTNTWTNVSYIMKTHWRLVMLGTIPVCSVFVISVALILRKYGFTSCFHCRLSVRCRPFRNGSSTLKDQTDNYLVKDFPKGLTRIPTEDSHSNLLAGYGNVDTDSDCV